MRAPTSKLSFEALRTTFFDRLDIFSYVINLKIILVVFVSALPAPCGLQSDFANLLFLYKSLQGAPGGLQLHEPAHVYLHWRVMAWLLWG